MNQKNDRSGKQVESGRGARVLTERAGWMPWSRRSERAKGAPISDLMELMEPRLLLTGDHPGVPMPFNPAAPATMVALDGMGNGTVAGMLEPGDTGDFFRFTVATTDFVSVLANTAGLGSSANTRVQVFDSTGALVAQGNDNGEITGTSPLRAPDGWAGFVAAPGMYFVAVTSQFATTGAYELRVRTQTTDVGAIDPMTGEIETTANVTELQGEQIFHVDIPLSDPMGANLDSIATLATTSNLMVPVEQRFDARVEVFSGSGQLVTADSQSGYLSGAFVAWRGAEMRRFYIRLRSDRLSGMQATGMVGLSFDFASSPIENAIDPVTRRGSDGAEVLLTPWDTASYRFTAQGTGLNFIVARDPVGEGSFALRLYSGTGQLLAYDDDFVGNEPQIEIPLQGGVEYFVVVDGFEPPPIPPPPPPPSPVPINLFIEASHTFDSLQPVDDHIDRPTTGTPGQIRRQFDLATPLTFNAPHLLADLDEPRNPALDHSWVIDATATGRIHTQVDSDLFKLVAPIDMLGSYAGDNDNAGTALYVGGRFQVADPDSFGFLPQRGVENVPSRGVATFDAGTWWFAGPQGEAASGDPLGFLDNPATAGTAGPEIYAMTVWDPDGAANGFFGPMLVVGGDFLLNIDDGFGGVITLTNLAVWGSLTPTATNGNPSAYSWTNIPLGYGLILGDANAPVRALISADPDGDGADSLFAGGDFTMIGAADWAFPPIAPTAAMHLAEIGPGTGFAWAAVGTGITGGANPTVRALAVYDPPDPGAGNPSGMPPVADPPDMPEQLVIGGTFTNAGGTTVNNIAFFGLADDMAMAPTYSRLGTAVANGVTGNNGQNAPGGNLTGVYALTVWDPPSVNDNFDPDPVLMVGGNFTTAGGVAGMNNIAMYGVPQTGMEEMTNPRLLWLRSFSQVPADPTMAPIQPGVNPGFGNTVFALATWDPPDFSGLPPIEPVVLVGGAFSTGGFSRMALYTGAATNQAFGQFDDIVRTITIVSGDEQEQGIRKFTFVDDDREVVYVGGDFTEIAGDPFSHVAQLDVVGFGTFGFTPLRQGVDDTVFALTAFDDADPAFDNSAARWDRNDRPSSRAVIRVAPSEGSFLNALVRIYDGAFNMIYQNDTVSPFPDPAGSNDPAVAPGLGFIAPPMVAGATYYIEVVSAAATPTPTGRQHGRYNMTVTIDGMPPDVNGDGEVDDTISQILEGPDAGQWTSALRLGVDAQLNGDTTNYNGTAANFDPNAGGPVWVSPGFPFDSYSIGSGGPRVRVYGQGGPFDVQQTTPTGFFVSQQTDFAAIETIEDTDLYYFRANGDGYVEVRINTTNIAQEFGEQIWDFSDGQNATVEYNSLTQPISSPLDSMIRIFNNDLQEVATNSYNPGVAGESATTTVGTLGQRIFWHRDARVVIPVRAGEVYFIQIESGQLATFMDDPNNVDWGIATGAYELLLNALSDFNPDGSDDHTNTWTPATGDNQATPVPIDVTAGSPTNGQGSVTGTIRDIFNNPNEPNNDLDLFAYYATGTGTVRLTSAANNGSNVSLSVIVLDDTGQTVVTGTSLPGGSSTVTWFAQQGERYFVRIDGAGGSQGDYILNFEGIASVDDHANFPYVDQGTVLTIDRYLGTLTGSGRIENAGDTDVFQFSSSQYVPDIMNRASIRVVSTTPSSLDVRVRVYEVQVDLSDNEYRALIALNDDERDPNNPNGAPLSQDAFGRFSITPGRTYYIVVEGEDPNADFGDYTLTVTVNPTDDHPDFAAFPLASDIPLTADLNVGAVGSRGGVIEIPEDDDVFRFTAQAGGSATVTLTPMLAGSFSSVLTIYNSSGTQITMAMGDVTGAATVNFIVSRGQSYFIRVDVGGMSMPTNAAYTVGVVAPPNDDHPNQGEFPLASVIFLNSSDGMGSRTGEIRPAGLDTDLFRVTTRVAGALNINVTTDGSTLNPRIMVFDSSFVLIPGSTDNTDTASQIIMASAANQVYYILVLSDTVGGGSQEGAYTVTASQTIPGGGGGGGGGGTDDHANAGNFANATPIALNSRTGDATATGIINFVGDTDLFTFVTSSYGAGVTGTRPVYLQITTPSGGLVDGTVRVFDGTMAHNLVAQDSNGVPGATANLVFQATAGTRYYILVEPVASNLGSYVVRLDTEPQVHFLYYPEGYSSSAIDEFIPIVNPNNFAVTYSIIARYETGTRDEVIVSNAVIPANSRGGHTVSTRGTSGTSLVRRDTPYALEVQANGQLTATFSHYDFGITTGENFTNVTSTTWMFSEVRKDVLNFRDFVLFYNPNNTAANLAISLVYDDGQVVTFNRTVDALRRSGLNFTNDTAVPREGRFAVRITSSQPIVAALSSYRITGAKGGYGLLGNADGGATRGAIPLVSTGSGVDSSVSIFNSSTTQSASVTITATYLNAGLPDLVRVVSVSANSRRTFTLAELGVVAGLQAGLRYQASIPVTVTYAEYQNGDADATMFGTNASQTALFGDAFVNPQAAGTTYIENLGIYNPAAFDTDVTVRFLFNDGSVSAPITRRVTAGRYDVIRIDQQAAILNRPGLAFFSIRVDAIAPVVTYFTHYDLFLNGGWATLGAPVGLTNPVSTIG
ncbi:MAG: hypothetical protein AB7G11_02975 [Phycisphaerales bacterium]